MFLLVFNFHNNSHSPGGKEKRLGHHQSHQADKFDYYQQHYYPRSHSVTFEIEGQVHQLNLTQSFREVFSSETWIWEVSSNHGQSLQPIYKEASRAEINLEGDFYVDNKQKAVVLVYNEQTGPVLSFDGVVGEGERRKIIISRSNNDRIKRKTKLPNVVQKIPRCKNLEQIHDYRDIVKKIKLELDKIDVVLDILYPKLLVVVDYHLFKDLNKDLKKTVEYVATYWNIVDQKYSSLESPKVQIVITGLIIATDERALNFIYKHRVGPDHIDQKLLLKETATYFSKKFSSHLNFENYNAVFVMTGLAMKNKGLFFEELGLTFKDSGICSNDRNIAIVSDNGQFASTLVAAHELGHLLKLEHDYAKACHGPLHTLPTVMSMPSNSADIFWSECSKNTLRNFSRSMAAKCLASRSKI
ncbi:hypothetical protein QAD02_006622 [Eretmocerus hayati]|uniref:Uncharacterized protein n=1 Tax=Eretmocerus hayati TaxID=131215 RepID=A0ACC2N1C2_9HYME|nr:hypothetical protein QAD02_006622 [Eretmocerus hayati]